jgi:hypothetical protein
MIIYMLSINACVVPSCRSIYLSISCDCYGHVLLRIVSLRCHVVMLWVLCVVVCLCCSLVDRAFEPI